jgi:acyl-CoA thioester hydrolase
MSASWDLPAPHVIEIAVLPADIDEYNHVNNSVYLSWLDRVAWSHSAALGISLAQCMQMRRGMAAHRTVIDYLRAAVLGDTVEAATWITSSDSRLRVVRRFQVRRVSDEQTLARAQIDYVCINLDSGRAARMPELFAATYVPDAAVQAASAATSLAHPGTG